MPEYEKWPDEQLVAEVARRLVAASDDKDRATLDFLLDWNPFWSTDDLEDVTREIERRGWGHTERYVPSTQKHHGEITKPYCESHFFVSPDKNRACLVAFLRATDAE